MVDLAAERDFFGQRQQGFISTAAMTFGVSGQGLSSVVYFWWQQGALLGGGSKCLFDGGNDVWSFHGKGSLQWWIWQRHGALLGGGPAAARVCFDGGNGSWNFTAGVRWWQMARLTEEGFQLWFLDGLAVGSKVDDGGAWAWI